MLFNSWDFVPFLLLIFVAHFWLAPLCPNKGATQVFLLVFASLIFYGYGDPWLIFLLVTSIVMNGVAARFLLSDGHSERARRLVCVLAVVGNLSGIVFFKYAGLIARAILPGTVFARVIPWLSSIPLPLGISFYTFEGLSLIVDAYGGSRREGLAALKGDLKGRPTAFFGRVALFLTFFPHLVAGPIVRGHEFIGQIKAKTLADVDWYYAIRRLIMGFFMKMVVADNLKEVTALLSYPNFLKLTKPNLVMLLYGYSFQIFADFAGYSLIAMGLAALFGYRFPLNFNLPYLSLSFAEFWRRWHISLSSWLRDYLYIPLGGNRKGQARSYFNLFAVMFLGGLWHGAAWSYAIWGSAHGVFLAIERMFRNLTGADLEKPSSLPMTLLRMFAVFNVVSLLWLLFKLPHFEDVVGYFHALAHARWGLHPQITFVMVLFSIPVVLWHAWGAWGGIWPKLQRIAGSNIRIHCENVLLGAMLFLILVNSGPAGTFIYFQF